MTFFSNPGWILNLIVLVLFGGLLVSLLLPANKINLIRATVLSTSFFALTLGTLLCVFFDKGASGFQFLSVAAIPSHYHSGLVLGVDGLSFVFVFLTLIIFPFCFLASWSVVKQTKHFFCYLLAMEVLLILAFSTLDIFYFYVFFESLLIPMFILIGVWGARERKIKAAYYFFLYTLFGSLFMLFGILYLYFVLGSTSYFILTNSLLAFDQERLLWVCFFFAFAVKMPLFPFHIWLPEAHVEAPTVGSMLLASLLLKLGGYGFLRFCLSLIAGASKYYTPFVFAFALLGVIYGSLSTIRQIDLKRIIAYSSVAHMNLVMLGLFSNQQQGLEGAIYLMISHGVVSAALFFCVGVLYDRYHTRLLRYYGGLVLLMPLFSTFFFLFSLANMSFPGTSNFLGELLLFVGVFSNNTFALLFATTGIVLSAVYSTWVYNRVIFGTLKTEYVLRFYDVTRREHGVLVFLSLLMLILGITANFLIDFLHVFAKTSLLFGAFFPFALRRRAVRGRAIFLPSKHFLLCWARPCLLWAFLFLMVYATVLTVGLEPAPSGQSFLHLIVNSVEGFFRVSLLSIDPSTAPVWLVFGTGLVGLFSGIFSVFIWRHFSRRGVPVTPVLPEMPLLQDTRASEWKLSVEPRLPIPGEYVPSTSTDEMPVLGPAPTAPAPSDGWGLSALPIPSHPVPIPAPYFEPRRLPDRVLHPSFEERFRPLPAELPTSPVEYITTAQRLKKRLFRPEINLDEIFNRNRPRPVKPPTPCPPSRGSRKELSNTLFERPEPDEQVYRPLFRPVSPRPPQLLEVEPSRLPLQMPAQPLPPQPRLLLEPPRPPSPRAALDSIETPSFFSELCEELGYFLYQYGSVFSVLTSLVLRFWPLRYQIRLEFSDLRKNLSHQKKCLLSWWKR